jgi:signal transduction histidine kinase
MSVIEQISDASWQQMAMFLRDVAQSDGARLSDWVVQVADLLSAEAVAIVLNEPKRKRLRCVASTVPLKPTVESGQAIVPSVRSLSATVIASGQPHRNTGRDRSLFEYLTTIPVESAFAVPLLSGDERVGVLEVVRRRDNLNRLPIAQMIASAFALAIVRDRDQAALRHAKAEIATFDQLKADFVGVASHELMSPLAVIVGHVSMVREDVQGEMGQQLDLVLKAAARIRELVDDMINLRYIDAGQTQLDLSRFDLAEFVKSEAEERRHLFEAKGQSLRLRITKRALPVAGDQRMFSVVLDVLLKNATKFTDEGGTIGVVAEERDGKAWFAVADSGIGIPAEELERIFGRFYQVEHHLRRKYSGMGLGLAIAKDLVELHEGRIWADSEVGKGSQFNVMLPLMRDLEF